MFGNNTTGSENPWKFPVFPCPLLCFSCHPLCFPCQVMYTYPVRPVIPVIHCAHPLSATESPCHPMHIPLSPPVRYLTACSSKIIVSWWYRCLKKYIFSSCWYIRKWRVREVLMFQTMLVFTFTWSILSIICLKTYFIRFYHQFRV